MAISGDVIGSIDIIEGDRLEGWLLTGKDGSVRPAVLVDGYPAELIEHGFERDDVRAALNVPDKPGFRFRVGNVRKNSKIELFAVESRRVFKVLETTSGADVLPLTFLEQLSDAVRISSEIDSVAITCWEGSHNPIGRSKVLYDVIAGRRNTILVTYLMDEFGGRIWHPLLNSPTALLSIPYEKRRVYEQVIHALGISFDLVYVSKSRLPSFQLANALHDENSLIAIDFDDDEILLSSSPSSAAKVFGPLGANLIGTMTQGIAARTAASRHLADMYQASLLRHARDGVTDAVRKDDDADQTVRIAFLGTARAHKGLVAAARAINIQRYFLDRHIEFVVQGDIPGGAYAEQLRNYGVTVRGPVPLANREEELSKYDVILTGFPSSNEVEQKISEHQISSKIGDALSIGIPVLVPENKSTSDLKDVNGVYLFTPETFGQALRRAIDHSQPIELPEDFSLDGAYDSFLKAESIAASSAKAREVLKVLPNAGRDHVPALVPTLLLMWKQYDAGLYGRRIDQIARSYKRMHPQHRVVVLEFLHDNTRADLLEKRSAFHQDRHLLLDLFERKQAGFQDADGIEFRVISFRSSAELPAAFEEYLVREALLPQNTSVILFPYIRFLESLLPYLRPYRKMADIVDNQLGWFSPEGRPEVLSQYFSVCNSVDLVVFNSQNNLDYFRDSGILPGGKEAQVIPNWYALPKTYAKRATPEVQSRRGIVYSGNMMDRVNWSLLRRIADSFPDEIISLIGMADATRAEFNELLSRPNVIYHGPLNEYETLLLLETARVAVIPHVVDELSNFMNPLKVMMYSRVGLPAVSSNMPGIRGTQNIDVAATDCEFIDMLAQRLKGDHPTEVEEDDVPDGERYMAVIEELTGHEPVRD